MFAGKLYNKVVALYFKIKAKKKDSNCNYYP